jgi:hypothetical protein
MKSKKKSSSTKESPKAKTKDRKALAEKSKASTKPAVVDNANEEVSKYQYSGETHPDTQMVNPSLRMQRPQRNR